MTYKRKSLSDFSSEPVTLWRSDEAMREAAYHDGRHRARMEQNRAGLMFDYSSFTRLRALHSQGDWDGDPFAELHEGAMT